MISLIIIVRVQNSKRTINQLWLTNIRLKRNLSEGIKQLTGFIGRVEERLRKWAEIKCMPQKDSDQAVAGATTGHQNLPLSLHTAYHHCCHYYHD